MEEKGKWMRKSREHWIISVLKKEASHGRPVTPVNAIEIFSQSFRCYDVL